MTLLEMFPVPVLVHISVPIISVDVGFVVLQIFPFYRFQYFFGVKFFQCRKMTNNDTLLQGLQAKQA